MITWTQTHDFPRLFPLPSTNLISIGISVVSKSTASQQTEAEIDIKEQSVQQNNNNIKTAHLDELPPNAQNAYKNYQKVGWKGNYSGQAPGTKAGRVYKNRNEILPKHDSMGNPITYKEFDVNNYVPGSTRDAERFVVGSDGSVYYTDSHYGQSTSPSGLSQFVKIE